MVARVNILRQIQDGMAHRAWALKEWAAICSALEEGAQMLLLRKGGIGERSFVLPARRFALAPTSLHQRPELLRITCPVSSASLADAAGLEPPAAAGLSSGAQVESVWSLVDPAQLDALSHLHVLTPEYALQRLQWRPKRPLTLLALRVYRFLTPVPMCNDERFSGCRSWVPLDVDLPWGEVSPVVDDQRHQAWMQDLMSLLGQSS